MKNPKSREKLDPVEHFFARRGGLLSPRTLMRSANAHELLRASATNDEKKVAELLMAGGNDIRQAVNDALSISARRGYTKIVKLLLGGGADGNGLGAERHDVGRLRRAIRKRPRC